MKKILMIIGVIGSFIACTKHEVVIDTTFQVGNILCSDGSVLHPSLFPTSGKKAVGVIFWTNTDNSAVAEYGYAIALDDVGSDILLEKEDDISNVTEDEQAFDGSSNTAGILSFAKEEEIISPAANLAVQYSPYGVDGWFIPSVAQTRQLFLNKDKVYKSFELVGGVPFDAWYWTSTEDGSGKDTPAIFMMVCSINEGRFTPSSKLKSNKVRPIISIR